MIINQGNLKALFVGFQNLFQDAFDATPVEWSKMAMPANSKTSEEKYGWLGNFPKMKEWIGDRQYENLQASDYTVKNKKFESTIEVDRSDIEDDKIGLYTPIFKELGRAGQAHYDELVYDLLTQGFDNVCYDGKPFFSAEHKSGKKTVSNMGTGTGNPWFLMDASRAVKPLILQKRQEVKYRAMTDPNSEGVFRTDKFVFGADSRDNVGYGLWQMAYGSKGALTAANYAAAREAIGSAKKDNGQPIGLRGTLLVVGMSNEAAGREILIAERNTAGATNVWRNTAELLVSSYLS